ncbi:MAG TPA: alpha/beta fold hydrolase [Terriglobales bacterium]|nr:alpha/beta fold hydrolase [Terriglobales bacterium]
MPFTPTDFKPHRLLVGGHAQTLAGRFLPRRDALPPADERLFSVEAGVEVMCRCHWQADRRAALTVIVVHGLEGSSESQYVIGTANKAWAAGMNVVRMNMRNCGGTEMLGPTLYHSGMSGDVGAVMRALITDDKLAHVALAGFSMGGNLALKLAGELGRDRATPPELRAVAAVSPAADLGASADALSLPSNRIYEWHFVRNLKRSVRRKALAFPGRYDVSRLAGLRSVRDFDEHVTAPYSGFANADDYYFRAAAARVIEHIAVPTLIIHAADDPFIRLLPPTRAAIAANPHVVLEETAHGGHCGFVGEADRNGYDGRWAEREIVRFFATPNP